MAFSPEEQKILDYAKQNGKTATEAKAAIAKYRMSKSTEPEPSGTAAPKPTFGEDLVNDLAQTGENMVTQFKEVGPNIVSIAKNENLNAAEKAVGIGGEAFKRGGRFIGGTILGAVKAILPQSVEDKAKEVATGLGEKIGEYNREFYEKLQTGTATDQEIAATIKNLATRYETDEKFRTSVDAAGGFLEGLAEIVGGGSVTRAAGKAASVSSDVAMTPVRSLKGNLRSVYTNTLEKEIAAGIDNTKRSFFGRLTDKAVDTAVQSGQKAAQTYRDLVEGSTRRIAANLDRQALRENAALPIAKVENNISDMYVNAVSPGVKGKQKTVAGIVQNKKDAVSSIRNLVENKASLTFRDIETNNMVTGELPTNLWEFGGAVTHQKSQVYNKVLENIGKAADEPIDTGRIVDAMSDIIDDPVYKGETQIVNRARQALNKYMLNDYTPRQIEDLIQLENDRLQAFYRGSGTQADAIVSAIIANNLRDMLDEAVESATGAGVRELKRQYGALKAIEGDVVHRALHNSQAREAGLVDMFGIRTIGDVAMGATGDLTALRRSAGQIAGEGFIKALNDRDAMINRMFLVAEQAYTR